MTKHSKEAASPESFDIHSTAEQNFNSFVNIISDLVTTQDVKIDLLVGGGNTGLVMMCLTELVFKQLAIAIPNKIVLPTYRYLPGHRDDPDFLFDNAELQVIIDSSLSGNPPLENVLFVDDEIGLGITALTILRLLIQWQHVNQRSQIFQYYIVAEDMGFVTQDAFPDASLHFLPFAKEVDGWYNVITYFVPKEFLDPINAVLPEEVVPSYQKMNILLGLPLKEFNNGHPRFDHGILNSAINNVPDFQSLQQAFKGYLVTKVKTILR